MDMIGKRRTVSNRNDGSTPLQLPFESIFNWRGAAAQESAPEGQQQLIGSLSPSLTNGWLIRSPPAFSCCALTRNWFDDVWRMKDARETYNVMFVKTK